MLAGQLRLVTLLGSAALILGFFAPARADWSSDGLPVAPSDSLQSDPAIASDGNGGTFLVWQDYRLGHSAVFAQHLTSQGNPADGWPTSGLQISDALEYDPFIVADGSGGAFVASTDGRYIGFWHLAANYTSPASVITALASLDGAVDRNVVLEGSTPAAAQKTSPTVLPVLLADGAGGVFLACDLGAFLNEYVAAQHFQADGTVASPWPAGGKILSYGHDPVICGDGKRGLIVAFLGGAAMHANVTVDTVVADWPGGVVPVSTVAGWKNAPGIVSDGAGGAITVWQDRRNSLYEQVYAQRLTASGSVSPGWPDSGLAVCTFPTDAGLTRYSPGGRSPQSYSVVIGDGAGGALITWHDMRVDDGDVYVQHLMPDGTFGPGWPANGVAVCNASGIQMAPSMASDGAGGAFVCWQDRRSGSRWDVYVQHLLASGARAPGWNENGVLACTGAGDHLIPRLVDGGSDRAIVAWQDTRLPSVAIFAAQVTASETPAAGPCVATASVVSSSADSGTVHIVWQLSQVESATVYCRQVDGPWTAGERRAADRFGRIDYADEEGIAGCRYDYALGVGECEGSERILGEVWIDVPDGSGFAPLSAAARLPVAEAGRLRLSWQVTGGEGLTATVSRRDSCSAWAKLGTAVIDDTGLVQFMDEHLFEGHKICYRLEVHACGWDNSLVESWTDVPTGDGFIPTEALLLSAETGPTSARLVWQVQSGPPSVARIYRRDSTSTWAMYGEPAIDPQGAIRFDDEQLQAGMRYEYRLGLLNCGVERAFGPIAVQIPAVVPPHFELAIHGSSPNPSRAGLKVSFTLANSSPAILEVFDTGGRLVLSRSVGGLAPGEHVITLGNAAELRPGFYLVRLIQGGQTRTARATILR